MHLYLFGKETNMKGDTAMEKSNTTEVKPTLVEYGLVLSLIAVVTMLALKAAAQGVLPPIKK